MAEEDQDQKQTLIVADETAAAEENKKQEIAKRSLALKLKIPTKFTEKEGGEDDDDDLPQHQPQHEVALRTCSECGKQFTSGKALGGHKRACLLKIKNAIAVKLDGDNNNNNNNNDNDQENNNNNNNNNICYVCHQSFRSVKSLYGHMRKHPERDWRGVQPPKRLLMNPPPHQPAASSVDDDCNDDGGGNGVESWRGWRAKRKRGQKLITSSSSSSSSEDKEEEEAMQQAVNDLLLLSQLSVNDCATMSKKENRAIDDHEEDQDDDGEEEKKKVHVDDQMKDEGLGFVDHDHDHGDDDSSEMEVMKLQKKNKKRRLNELDDIAVLDAGVVKDETQTYSCTICNKAFDKHQALGGHVASHSKYKNVKESSSTSASAAEDTKPAAPAAASDEETGESSRILAAAAAAAAGAGAGSSSEHKCKICNKTFPTGQALGGHKRCHWTGPAEAFSSSSQVTTSAGEVTQRAPTNRSPNRVVHDFDLNDTPPEYYQFHGVEAAATVS